MIVTFQLCSERLGGEGIGGGGGGEGVVVGGGGGGGGVV